MHGRERLFLIDRMRRFLRCWRRGEVRSLRLEEGEVDDMDVVVSVGENEGPV